MPRLYSNNFSTTLASGISAIDSSLDVASATGLPALESGQDQASVVWQEFFSNV